jgi:uncharacterized protein (TIGR02996 family)
VVNARLYLERPGQGFVELWTEGHQLWRTWGARGAERGSRHEPFNDAALAERALDVQIIRLERKGYLPGHHNLTLLQAIQANPSDASPYLVYADWLLERSDPRGELIARMAANRSFDDLLAEHARQLAPAWCQQVECTWRLGFLERVTLKWADASLLCRVFRHPSASVLSVLKIETRLYIAEREVQRLFAKRPPTLTRIAIGDRLPRVKEALGRVPGVVLV